jgi:hypothetical protein
VTMYTPAPGISSTTVNRCGLASAGSVLDANSWRPAQTAAPRHPVSRASSRCNLVMHVGLWGRLSRAHPSAVAKPASSNRRRCAPGDVAPCVSSSRPSCRVVNFSCRCSRIPLRLGRAHPSAVARLPPETTSPEGSRRRGNGRMPRRSGRRLAAPGDFRSSWRADGP